MRVTVIYKLFEPKPLHLSESLAVAGCRTGLPGGRRRASSGAPRLAAADWCAQEMHPPALSPLPIDLLTP